MIFQPLCLNLITKYYFNGLFQKPIDIYLRDTRTTQFLLVRTSHDLFLRSASFQVQTPSRRSNTGSVTKKAVNAANRSKVNTKYVPSIYYFRQSNYVLPLQKDLCKTRLLQT